jgi:MoaA/NifB/PqqE/SkfB family radical SAM enzyme
MKQLTASLGALAAELAQAKGPVARAAAAATFLRELSYAKGLLHNLGPPKIFQLETTNHCPYTCVMCPRTHAMRRPLGHMDIGLFREIVDQLEPAWQHESWARTPLLRLLHFGEPMVYRHFTESVEHCHRRGFQVYISTNPSIWTQARIDELLATRIDRVQVMFDGLDDATSTAIRGAAASYTRGAEALRALGARKVALGLSKPHLTVQMIRQPRNRHQWEAFATHWRDFPGIDAVYLDHFSTFDGAVPEINALAAETASLDSGQRAFEAQLEELARHPCVYPWQSVSVTWDGKVVPCCRDADAASVLGDLSKQTLLEVWNGAPLRELRRAIKAGTPPKAPCGTCKEPSLEVGLPRLYKLGHPPTGQT